MPKKIYKVQMDAGIREIWEFISSMNNWVPLLPGYVSHEHISETMSFWEFKTSGLLSRKIKFRLDILQWREPSTIHFKVTGINEKILGEGILTNKKTSDYTTEITARIEINAYGTFSGMVNSLLETKLEDFTEELPLTVNQFFQSYR